MEIENGCMLQILLNKRSEWLWMGVVCLLLACAAGVQAILDVRHGVSMRTALSLCGILLLAEGLLLAGERRAAVWQETALSEEDKQAFRLTRTDYSLLCILTIVAFIPRLIAMRHSLWYDELWTLEFMQHGPVYAVTHQIEFNNHLLNSLLGSVMVLIRDWLYGTPPTEASVAVWVRIPALIFGTAAVPALYIAVRRYIDRPVAAGAALLLALSPVGVDLSAQTRGYSGLIFFTIVQAQAFDAALRLRNPRCWTAWLLWATFGACENLYMVFPVAVDMLCLLIAAQRLALHNKEPNKTYNVNGRGDLAPTQNAGAASSAPTGGEGEQKHSSDSRDLFEQGGFALSIWALIVLACYMGVLGGMYSTWRSRASQPPLAYMHEMLYPLLQIWGGMPQGSLLWGYLFCCVILTVAGLWYLFRNAPAFGLYLALLLVLPPIVIELMRPYFLYFRFFAFALPAFLVWIACGLWQAADPARRWGGKLIGSVVYSMLMAVWIGFTLPGLRAVLFIPKQDYRRAADMLQQAQQQGLAVAVVGLGRVFFDSYGVHAFKPQSPIDLVEFTRRHGKVLVIDTDLEQSGHKPTPELTRFLRRYGGSPIKVFHGRYPGWPYRWAEGGSDFQAYLIQAANLPDQRQR